MMHIYHSSTICCWTLTVIIVTLVFNGAHPKKVRPNILFLMADDLRMQLNHNRQAPQQPFSITPEMITPNLDSLAARSMIFNRAYVQIALCNPSRTSALTSRRPDTTRVYDNDAYFRHSGGDFMTIPQFFMEHGYNTLGIGKIFHQGNISKLEDKKSWSQTSYDPPNNEIWGGGEWGIFKGVTSAERNEAPLPDDQITDKAIEMLQMVAENARKGIQPFFLAVGFRKPHKPFIFPEEILNYYPESSIRMPSNPFAPVDMPAVAWQAPDGFLTFSDLKKFKASAEINTSCPLPDFKIKQIRRAYYSCVTFIDSLAGRILKELKVQNLEKNTIISFWGDHGYHLDEHGEYEKLTNFEVNTRVPFMIHIPGLTDKGKKTNQLVEMVDLFPTLVDAAGFPPIPLCPSDSSAVSLCTEGTSLMSVISDTSTHWKTAAFFQVAHNNGTDFMGYGMRTDTYRYTEWLSRFHGTANWNDVVGVELYDLHSDPEENYNQINNVAYADVAKDLSEKLHLGWRANLV